MATEEDKVNVAATIKLFTDKCDMREVSGEYVFSSSPSDEVLGLFYDALGTLPKKPIYNNIGVDIEVNHKNIAVNHTNPEFMLYMKYKWNLLKSVDTANILLELNKNIKCLLMIDFLDKVKFEELAKYFENIDICTKYILIHKLKTHGELYSIKRSKMKYKTIGEFLRLIELYINKPLGIANICSSKDIKKQNATREQIYMHICQHSNSGTRIKLVQNLETNNLKIVDLLSYLENTNMN